MFSKKPEYIDSDEKNLTYYYDRNKLKNRLAKKKLKKRKGLLIFRTTKGKAFLVAIYLILVLYLFMAGNKVKKIKPYISQYKDVLYKLTVYALSGNEISLQLLLKNTHKDLNEISEIKGKIILVYENKLSLTGKKIKIESRKMKSKGLKNYSYEIKIYKKPQKVKMILNIDNEKIILEKRL